MRIVFGSLVVGAALGGLLGSGCHAPESGAAIENRSQPVATGDLRNVKLGQTSPADVERLFGVPEERYANGDLRYRWTVRPGEEGEVTFKFENGVLSKLCQDRS